MILFVCVCTLVSEQAAAFQGQEQVRARTGIRGYLLAGVYDNMTLPGVPAGRSPLVSPLRYRGLYELGRIPGFSQSVQVQVGHRSILFRTLFRNREVQKPTTISFSKYLEITRREQTRRRMLANFLETREEEESGRNLLQFEIPISVPRGIERVVGEGGAELSVRGNRNIRFSGKSEWTEGAVSTATAYTSKFPALNMEQDSRFEIIGNVGSKVEVSVLQDTRALTDLENRINIRYRGDEDEILQELIAGNTDFSLPGSQFIGFNQGAKGLFGIKGTARVGDLTFTALASQEKGSGEKATFEAGAKQTEIRRPDIEPLLGTYYFLDEVYRDRFPTRTYVDADSIISISVFLDDQQYRNDTEKAAVDSALAFFDPSNPSPLDSREAHLGSFHELDPGEYYMNRAAGYLALNVSLGPKEVLGVVYTTLSGEQVGSAPTPGSPDIPLIMKLIKPTDPRPDDVTWKYELRNVYYLGSRNIPAEGFRVRIFYDPPSGEDEYTQDGVDFLQILGLDRWGEVPGTPPDGNIDLNENYLNLARGELIFPDLEPFMNTALTDTVDMYDTIARYELTQRSRYYIHVTLSTRSATYSLPATSILEGSEVVTLNGRRLNMGVDYQINYLTGEITFLTDAIRDPSAEVKVDYEYRPLIQLEQKSLLGARAEYQLGRIGTLSGMILSRSERTMDRRIRLGREPNRTLVWDATAVMNLESKWLTRAVNVLPLIETDVPSTIDFEAEIAQSIPNPNTNNDALVDDFESVKNTTGFSIGRGRWTPASVPAGRTDGERARMVWFNPFRRVPSRDIWPGKETDIRSDRVNVMSLILLPNQPNPWPAGAYIWNTTNLNQRWNGIQQAVAAGAADLTQLTYLELWIQGYKGELHLDLGTISEDADGSGELNTEDILRNGVRNGVMDTGEDVGMDGLSDEQELNFYIIHAGDDPQNYPTVEAKKQRYKELYSDPLWYSYRKVEDPAHDNWEYSNPDIYSYINGTQENRLDPDRLARPDSEDINRNGYLDRSNNFVSYVLDLSRDSPDSVYVAGGDVDPTTWDRTDSWRLYRIPLTDIAESVGSPDLSLVQSVRIWLTAAPDTSAVEVSIVTLDVVGNHWRERPVEAGGVTLPPETVRVSVRNTFDNVGEYIPPPGVVPVRDRITNLLGQEQSLAVTFSGLPSGVEGEIFRSIIKAEDFTPYKGLAMYLNVKPAASWVANVDSSNVEAFLRFGADEKNFYEYHVRVYPDWDDRSNVEVDFAEITALKEALLNSWGGRSGIPDTTLGNYRVVGRPSLTNIRRISIGVTNRHPSMPIDGEIWADELRVVDVHRDRGSASRIALRMQLADFTTVDFRMNRRTADFHGLREKRGTLSTTTATNFQLTTALEKLTPDEWGLDIPLTITTRNNLNLPKFLPGSDLILEEGQQSQHRTSQEDQSLAVSIRKRSKSENRLVALTLDNMVVSLTGSRRNGRSPINPINRSYRVQGQFGYNLRPENKAEWHPFRFIPILPRSLRDTAFNPIPTQIGYSVNAVKLGERVADRTGKVRLRDAFTATEVFSLAINPFSPLRNTYSLTLEKDLTQDWAVSDWNLGREIKRRQLFETVYEPSTFNWVTQLYQYTVEYRENNDPRFNTRITPEGDRIQLGRNIVSVVEAIANYTILPTHLVGVPVVQDEGVGGFPKLINDLKKLVNRVTPVLLTLSEERTGNQYNLQGRPSLLYQFGLREKPGVDRVAAIATQQSSIQSVKRVRLNTGLNLPLSAFLDLRPQWQWIDNFSESKTIFSSSIMWPAVDIRWQGLQSLWIFPDFTSALFISSSYRRSKDKTDRLKDTVPGREIREPYSNSRTKTYTPLIGIQITLLNGIGISAGRNTTEVFRKQLTLGTSVTRTVNSDYHVDLSYRFSAPQGIKLPFIKKPLRFTSEVDARLRLSSREEKTEVRIRKETGYVPTISTATWSLRPMISYSFSRLVEGGIDMRFENVNDRLMDRTRKVREVSIFINLTFR